MQERFVECRLIMVGESWLKISLRCILGRVVRLAHVAVVSVQQTLLNIDSLLALLIVEYRCIQKFQSGLLLWEASI